MTLLRVKFRRNGHDENGRLVPAYSEDLDVDQLTPRARALAEALHDTTTHCSGLTSLDVVFECERTNAEQADRHPRVPDAYRPIKNPDVRATRTVRWDLPSASSPLPLVFWLEEQARIQPLDWYPIGAPNRPRVPTWEAGAADRYLTRTQALEYLREHGAPLSDQGWDTLRPTPILTPDRHAAGRPQWRPETVQAFADRPRDLWPLSRVAGYLGLTAGSARVQMRRWGFTAEGRAPGRGGESLYPADLVEAAHTHRPKRGRPPKGAVETPGF